MVAKPAGAVVVLAMDVSGDHAADRDEFGPGNDRRKEASRQERGDDVAQHRAGFDGEPRLVPIEAKKAIEAR